ncbi:MAG: MFS transporter [Kutzneria sp.]|nr:MFS transporter [Kutzneria sp.]MBV9844472.1 MFS transporter [Kutzneria sp.]
MAEVLSLRPPTAARRSTTAVFALHALVFAAWTAHIPTVKDRIGLDDGALGLALLGAPAGAVCALLGAGVAVARWGSKPVVTWSLGGYAAVSTGLGLTDSWSALFAALAVWGALQSTLDIAMNAQAVAVEHGYGTPIMASFHAWWSLAGFLGAGLGTLAVGLRISLGWQMFVLGVVITAIARPLTRPMLREDFSTEEHRVSVPWRSRALIVLGVLMFAGLFCEGAMGDWTALYLHGSLKAPSWLSGAGYAVFAVAMFVGRSVGDRMVARVGDRAVVATLAGVGAVGFGATLLVGDLGVALAGLVLFGLGLSCVVPIVFRAAAAVGGVHPGTAIAGASTAGWAGMLLGPPTIGLLSHATSLPLALGLLPVLCAAISLGALAFGRA